MPELPEVETIKRQLTREVKGAEIDEVTVRFGKRLTPRKSEFIRTLKGRSIEKIERRAKILRMRLSGGWSVFVHLKMTGLMLVKETGAPVHKHTHVVLKLSNGKEIHWNDFRKFGFMKAMKDPAGDEFLKKHKFGPEPLGKNFGWQNFAVCLRRHPKSALKPLLMRPDCIAGIGNIYATEALWKAKIHPETKIKDISDRMMESLHDVTVAILKRAVELRGTSADDFFDAYGKEGGYERELKAYGLDGEPCPRCRTKMIKEKIGGRGTVLCPKCQKK